MTSNASASDRILGSLGTADGKGVVHLEDLFDTPIDDVWAALTEREHLAVWYGELHGDLGPGGEYRARLHASGWEGTGRIEEFEAPRHFLIATTMDGDDPSEGAFEVTLAADGDRTVLVWEERGMPVEHLAAYGAGIQVHVEDLGAYLAGRGRCDADARWQELSPAYDELAATVG